MKIFFATYTDVVKFNRKPNEDYFLISKKYPIFVVADGVTRAILDDKTYAYPAGARAAAEIFCFSVVEYLENRFQEHNKFDAVASNLLCSSIITEALDFANARIGEMNKNEGMARESINFSESDFFDCVGATGFLVGNTFYYGYLSDCGFAVFDKNNKLRFQTEDKLIALNSFVNKNYGLFENKKERSRFLHKEFRNRSNGTGYGTFTGEQSVCTYYTADSLNVKEGEMIVMYTDGFIDYLQFPEFAKLLRDGNQKEFDNFCAQKAKENPEKLGTDRTVISIAI